MKMQSGHMPGCFFLCSEILSLIEFFDEQNVIFRLENL